MKLRHLLFGIYCLCCLMAMTWPGYKWAAHSDRLSLFGLPFSLVWVIGWVLATFVVLNLYHATDRERG